jgi:hypothetical protein
MRILQSQRAPGSAACEASTPSGGCDEIISPSTNSNSIGLNIEYTHSAMAYMTHRKAVRKTQKNGPRSSDTINPEVPVTGLSFSFIVCAPNILAIPQSNVKGNRTRQCIVKRSLSSEPLVSFLARILMLTSPLVLRVRAHFTRIHSRLNVIIVKTKPVALSSRSWYVTAREESKAIVLRNGLVGQASPYRML